MPIRPGDLQSILINKFGFIQSNRDHKWFALDLPDLPTIATKVSHGRKEIGRKLEGRIAKQLRVRKRFYSEMVGCTKSREDYYQQVREDPYPPWEHRFL